MTYLPPPKNAFDVEWATQNNRIIQQELGRLQPLQVRVADLESGKQPLDGDLTAIAALTGTGTLERTGSDAWALYTVTAAGKALIDDASASAQRTTLGLGDLATQNASAVSSPLSLDRVDTSDEGGELRFKRASDNALAWVVDVFSNTDPQLRFNSAYPSGAIPFYLTNSGFVSTKGDVSGDSLPQLRVKRNTAGNVRFDIVRPSLSTEVAQIIWATGASLDYQAGLIGDTNLRLRSVSALKGVYIDTAGVFYAENGAAITGNISASNLAGTTYTPTLRSTVDVNISSSTFQSASYIRVGSAVMATIQLFITPSASGSVRFSVTLPVSSNFTTNYQLGGTCAARDTVPLTGIVIGSATNDNAVAEFVAATTNAHEVTLQIIYPIL